jgi:hypothetical protein
MLLHGTIEAVYKGTLVYAHEHNPTLGYKPGPKQPQPGCSQINSAFGLLAGLSRIIEHQGLSGHA